MLLTFMTINAKKLLNWLLGKQLIFMGYLDERKLFFGLVVQVFGSSYEK